MNILLKWGLSASIAIFLLLPAAVSAQEIKTNFVEENVPAYSLPEVLRLENGRKVRNRRVWEKKRRAEVLEVLSQEMYGHVPARPEGLHFETLSVDTVYAGGWSDATVQPGECVRLMTGAPIPGSRSI